MSTKSFVCNRVNKEPDFNTLAYELQAERELSSGHINQTIYDFSQAIERNPTSPFHLIGVD